MKLQRKKERQADVVGEWHRREQHEIPGTDRERKKERDRRVLDGCGEI